MSFKIVSNTSEWASDEITPLLRFAYNHCKAEFTRTPPLMKVELSKTRRNTWSFKWNPNGCCRLSFCAPDKGRLPTAVYTPVRTMNEVVVATAAWAFICLAGREGIRHSMTVSAVQALREQGAETIAKVEAIRQGKVDREGEKFAQEVFADMERQTYEFKLAKIERLEKAWLRKAKLAATKLKTLRRRKSALKAAQTRKQQPTQELVIP